VSSKTKTEDAVPASFSLSSMDVNGVDDAKDYASNISSYFLMESDIRGNINNPGYYFDASNPRRLANLDLLLLTQGWRDFLWKKIPKEYEELTYKPEKGFNISGSVTQLFGDKPKPNNTVNLTLFSGGRMDGFNTLTDSIGVFEFETMVFMGESKVILKAINKRGKGAGKIELDALSKPSMPVDFKMNSFNKMTDINTLKESVYKKYVLNGIAPENVLDEVEIIAKKKNYLGKYGLVEFTYEAGKNESIHTDIYQLIQSEIPGVQIVTNSDGDQLLQFMRFGSPALIIINDVPILTPIELDAILPNEVAKINAYKTQTTMFGSQGANGVIDIYLKKGAAIKSTKEVFHSITEKIEGFYDARIFYSTDPNKPSIDDDHTLLAVRNTLYWNPYIHPDETGESKVSYYNSEVQTNVKITLEGLTATGIPVVVKTQYAIEK
jgi:hypothetical protein